MTVPENIGGRAWLIWFIGALSFGYAFFQRVAPSVMVDELMAAFAVSGAMLGNLAAIYLYAYAGLQIPIGAMLDRLGPRRMLSLAALVAGGGAVVFATAETVAAAYLGRLLIGVGSAVGFVGTLKLVAVWFPAERYAFLSGLTFLIAMLSGALGQAPLAVLVDAIGWRQTALGMAFAGLGLAALTWLLVRDRPPGRPAEPTRGAGLSGIGRDLRAVLGSRQNWIIALYGATMSGPMLAYAALWGVPHMMQVQGYSRPTAALLSSFVLMGWALGAPAGGWISDRVGRRKVPMILAALAALGGWLAVLYLPGLAVPAVGALLFFVGLASGGMVVCMAVAVELSPPSVSGATTGFVNMGNVGAGALMQPLVGLILDWAWDGRLEAGARVYGPAAYDMALATIPAASLVAIGAAFLIRETHCRPLTVQTL
jgi:MFS family permease